MTIESIVHLNLAEAFLCVECCVISNDSTRCPVCASEHGRLSLARVLERETEREVEVQNA